MLYASKSQFDKKAEKVMKTALRYKAIKSADEVEAILCANIQQDKNNYILCTNDSIICGLSKLATIVRTDTFLHSTISSISQSGGRNVITIVVGGGQSVDIKVMCEPEEARTFITYVSERTKEKPTGLSTADEIKKYKELLDIGAITEDEYQAKKKQLLGL